ncbi:MAG: DoxX family membrane protein [Polyangiaceae bacterium]|nr:DoxX family membrane protein [Polyangiaceae bacterium]
MATWKRKKPSPAGRRRNLAEGTALAEGPNRETFRNGFRLLLAAAMIGVGIMHFTREPFFTRIVPAWLPEPRLLVYLSGVFEVALGVGLLLPRTRKLCGLGLVALYIAVFPANVNMVVHPELGGTVPIWALWLRLPLQLVLIGLAYWVSRTPKEGAGNVV